MSDMRQGGVDGVGVGNLWRIQSQPQSTIQDPNIAWLHWEMEWGNEARDVESPMIAG